jgi:hypothetical protein
VIDMLLTRRSRGGIRFPRPGPRPGIRFRLYTTLGSVAARRQADPLRFASSRFKPTSARHLISYGSSRIDSSKIERARSSSSTVSWSIAHSRVPRRGDVAASSQMSVNSDHLGLTMASLTWRSPGHLTRVTVAGPLQ